MSGLHKETLSRLKAVVKAAFISNCISLHVQYWRGNSARAGVSTVKCQVNYNDKGHTVRLEAFIYLTGNVHSEPVDISIEVLFAAFSWPLVDRSFDEPG